MKATKNNYQFFSNFFTTLLKTNSFFSLLIIAMGLLFTSQNKNPVLAQASPDTTVDVELVLSVDVSGSISSREFNLQRDGYANAFRDPQVIAAIESLPNGLAVTLQYWSNSPHEAIGWYLVTDAATARNFADAIENAPRPSYGSTGLADAITTAKNLLLTNIYEGKSLVIDVSGDGLDNTAPVDSIDVNFLDDHFQTQGLDLPNYLDGRRTCANGTYRVAANTSSGRTVKGLARVPIENVICPALQDARDAAVAEGITINGLAILSQNPVVNSGKTLNNFHNLPFIFGQDRFAVYREDQIDAYYENNVIGGEGAFVETAQGFSDFSRAAVAKIQREITEAKERTTVIFAD
ncbi:MAG: DUF1194 domain-containing protein [Xenococcaceae cyanobacterium MO_207.B15]|nr:DUF1194 domain-containing protein [Xenococcaceae cyanobacterium MO_207.B15]MDJ0743641.1 DUF1194 domain-containing protein [Xenococcaceae cyanobacterium MO_167.B27]